MRKNGPFADKRRPVFHTAQPYDVFSANLTKNPDLNRIKALETEMSFLPEHIQGGKQDMKDRVFGKNEIVFREGDLGSCFYQITDGTAGVYLHYGDPDERKLTEMKPGQYFGEMAVIEAWPRSTTIVAEDELHTIELTGNDLVAYFEEQPDRIKALMNQLGDRIRTLTVEYDEVKAFIREKQTPDVDKKEGFLAKLMKYKELGILASKLVGCTVEDEIRQKDFGKAAEAALPLQTYSKGQIVFREGDEGAYMYQVHGGSVGIYAGYGTSEQNKLTTLYINSYFGEMGLIANETRSATAVIEETGTLLECIRAEDLETLFKANPLKIDMILSHLSNRLRKLTSDYAKACAEAAGI